MFIWISGLSEKFNGRNSFAFFLPKTQFFGMMFKTEVSKYIKIYVSYMLILQLYCDPQSHNFVLRCNRIVS